MEIRGKMPLKNQKKIDEKKYKKINEKEKFKME
jgi:hypothetical protein